MTPEQVVAIIVAVTGLTAAVGVVLVQLAQLRRDVNGRMTQLLEHASEAARKDGELAGRDYAAAAIAKPGLPDGTLSTAGASSESAPPV